MMVWLITVQILYFLRFIHANDDYLKLPEDFKIGVGASAYQTEGAWNVSDKSESNWDWLAHTHPSLFRNGDNGDIACDSYHKYREDVKLLKSIGVHHYRFSLSWARILPTGFSNKVSRDGIQYYKNLIDELLANEIEPYVTIYHWDHPQILQEMLGGWTNELMVEIFADYARVVFRELGHKVKFWTTINEVNIYCENFYSVEKRISPVNTTYYYGSYLCVHNILKAHARAYHIYNDEFRSSQNGLVGIIVDCSAPFPKHENDEKSAQIAFDFSCGWITNPIFSKTGDYPAVMKERIGENSRIEGLSFSRLPEFSPHWINYIKGTADYYGLNHYTSYIVEPAPKTADGRWLKDTGLILSSDPSWRTSGAEWIQVVPKGIRSVLNRIKNAYNNPPVYILEVGTSEEKGFIDVNRTSYLYSYMREVLLAIYRDNCDVKAYTIWSFLDNLEWLRAYTLKFGIVAVDFNDPNRKRSPRLSSYWLKKMLVNRKLISVDDVKKEV